MANSQSGGAFVNSFMQGFSFIDDINSRKRREAMLESRLAAEQEDRQFRRGVIEQQGRERVADRALRLQDRNRGIADELFQDEATAALALGVDATEEDLLPFARDPRVAAELSRRRGESQDQADLEQLLPRGLNAQATGGVDPATQQQSAGGLNAQVTELPGDQFEAPARTLSGDQLNELANINPAEAQRVRDQQNAQRAANDPLLILDADNPDAVLVPDPRGSGGVVTAANARQYNEDQARKTGKDQVNSEWSDFIDINNSSGDAQRALDPSLLTAKYFDQRGSIDPAIRNTADVRMGPAIESTIAAQSEILATPDVTPLEATNARRKLSEAYSLSKEIGTTYSAPQAAGVDARGVPLGNPEMTQNVIQQGIAGPGSALPLSSSMNKADFSLLQRGASGGRVNERQALAAYRQFKAGRLDLTAYRTYMTTGQLPSATPTFEQFDPEKPIYANYNGRLEMYSPAISGSLGSGRNALDEKGLAHLYKVAGAYNTEDDPGFGVKMANEFAAAMKGNEQTALKGGVDLSNVNDVAWVFDRWMKVHVIREQYNDEVFYDGRKFPDFTQDFGPMHKAIFNPDVDAIDLRSITDFFGEDPVQLEALPGMDPAKYDQIRQQIPEMAGASNEQIDAEIARQRAAGQ